MQHTHKYSDKSEYFISIPKTRNFLQALEFLPIYNLIRIVKELYFANAK